MGACPVTTERTMLLGDVALVQWEAGTTGTLPEGAYGRRPTMKSRREPQPSTAASRDPFSNSAESGLFLMEPRSDEARKWLRQLREMPDVRLKKIMKLRAEIQKGTYETAAKWRVALDRLLVDLRESIP
jgi:hypothetical protein